MFMVESNRLDHHAGGDADEKEKENADYLHGRAARGRGEDFVCTRILP